MSEIFIYKLIDPFTQDIRYIGKTTNITRRLQAHITRCKYNKYHSAVWVKSIIDKNSKPIIEVVEICTNENWQEREVYWINYYRNIYNLTNILDGGEGCATYGRLGSPWSESQRINNKKARLGKPVNHTPLGKINRANGIRKYYDNNKIPILQYDLDGNFLKEWPSAIDAGNSLSINYNNINRACKNPKNRASNYLWRFKENNIQIKIHKYDKTSSYNFKQIIQFDKNNTFIKEFSSIKDAAFYTKITRTSICNCLQGRSKVAGGFIFKYKENN